MKDYEGKILAGHMAEQKLIQEKEEQYKVVSESPDKGCLELINVGKNYQTDVKEKEKIHR